MREVLKITDKEEFNRAIAIWACEDNFDELKPKPYPSRPSVLNEYSSLTPEKRKHMNENPDKYSKFWSDIEVSRYFEDCEKIKNINRSNKEWLLDYKKWLNPVLDKEYIDKIDERLIQFDIFNAPDNAGWTE